MAFMACEENIVHRHPKGRPFLTSTAKVGHAFLAFSSLTRACGDHMRNRFPMSGDHYGLASLDVPEEFCKARLEFCGSHRLHHKS